MKQNTSHAVMQQRSEPKDSLDDFPTPPWATRALCEWLKVRGLINKETMCVAEPSCNRGFMSEALFEYFLDVYSSDIHDYGYRLHHTHDFLNDDYPIEKDSHSWIITNPPFNLAEKFILKALKLASRGVAILVRTSFLESTGRYERLFDDHPPTHVLQFVERLPMIKGKCANYTMKIAKKGKNKGKLIKVKVTTATSYCWLVWAFEPEAKVDTEFHWITPCRKRLEREGDYENVCT